MKSLMTGNANVMEHKATSIRPATPLQATRRKLRCSLPILTALTLSLTTVTQGNAQNPAKVAADQHAALIRSQITAAFRTTAVTGSVNELQNHLVINKVGAIYTVRKSNVLIASYSTTNAVDDPTDTSVTNAAGKSVPMSKKCHFLPLLSLPDFIGPPVPDACRRDLALNKAKLIVSGQRVLLAGVDVYVDKDRVEFLLLDHHKAQGVEAPRFVSQFVLQFSPGFLATADATQIAAALKPFLAPSDDPIMTQPFLADGSAPVYTLEDNLSAAYSNTAYQADAGTTAPGALLRVKADRFLRAIPQGAPIIACTPVLRDGRAKDPGFMCKSMGQNSIFMIPNDDLVVKTIKVESKKDKDVVRFELIDMSQVDPAPQPNGSTARYHGAVDIEFAKGSLGPGDVSKVEDQVAAAFNVSNLVAVAAAPQSAAAPTDNSQTAVNAAPLPAVAAPPQTLEQQLKTVYKLTTVAPDASVLSRGTMLTLTSDKLLLGTPYAKPAMCPASVVGGTAKAPAASCVTPLRSAILKHEATYFAKGQKLNVISISVDVPNETIAIGLIDDTSAVGGPTGAPKFHTMVNFVFPSGYLETSDAGQVGDLVNSILQMSSGQV